jgi:hypothetical protein
LQQFNKILTIINITSQNRQLISSPQVARYLSDERIGFSCSLGDLSIDQKLSIRQKDSRH